MSPWQRAQRMLVCWLWKPGQHNANRTFVNLGTAEGAGHINPFSMTMVACGSLPWKRGRSGWDALSSSPGSKTGMPENIVCPCFSSSPMLLLLLSVNSRHSINASRQTESLLSAAGLKVLPALPLSLGCGGPSPAPGLAPVNLLSLVKEPVFLPDGPSSPGFPPCSLPKSFCCRTCRSGPESQGKEKWVSSRHDYQHFTFPTAWGFSSHQDNRVSLAPTAQASRPAGAATQVTSRGPRKRSGTEERGPFLVPRRGSLPWRRPRACGCPEPALHSWLVL